MTGNLSAAIGAVPNNQIVEEFNIPHRCNCGRTWIICPTHNDKSFGSCLLDRKGDGYFCYAGCGHVNKWDMLLAVSGYSKSEAAKWFFSRSGLSPEEPESEGMRSVREEVKAASCYLKNGTVYDDISTVLKSESTVSRSLCGDYLASTPSISSPLMELYEKDVELFREELRKAKADKERKTAFLKTFFKSSSFAGLL